MTIHNPFPARCILAGPAEFSKRFAGIRWKNEIFVDKGAPILHYSKMKHRYNNETTRGDYP
jgi:hypothetical protein